MNIQALIEFYNGFSAQSVAQFGNFYSADAYFKDPFNEVRGIAAIERIFAHMFTQVAEPRFVVTEQLVASSGAMLVWEFHFRFKLWRHGAPKVIRGVSHLKFDSTGKVCYHRDYWDAAEELYMQLPVIGPVVKKLQQKFSA